MCCVKVRGDTIAKHAAFANSLRCFSRWFPDEESSLLPVAYPGTVCHVVSTLKLVLDDPYSGVWVVAHAIRQWFQCVRGRRGVCHHFCFRPPKSTGVVSYDISANHGTKQPEDASCALMSLRSLIEQADLIVSSAGGVPT